MFCAKCGKEVNNEDRFCPHCGAENGISDSVNQKPLTQNISGIMEKIKDLIIRRQTVLPLIFSIIALICIAFLPMYEFSTEEYTTSSGTNYSNMNFGGMGFLIGSIDSGPKSFYGKASEVHSSTVSLFVVIMASFVMMNYFNLHGKQKKAMAFSIIGSAAFFIGLQHIKNAWRYTGKTQLCGGALLSIVCCILLCITMITIYRKAKKPAEDEQIMKGVLI